MYIPDPSELMESAMDRQFSKIKNIDGVDKYPCCNCGRYFDMETMFPVDEHPAADLECDKDDCDEYDHGELANITIYSEKINKTIKCSQKGYDTTYSKHGWKIKNDE